MADDRSILIIANPTSGRGRGRRTANAVAERLTSRGVQTDVMETAATGDAEQAALKSCGDGSRRPDCIVACGGDGTMQEVANALASMRESLGNQCPVMGLAPAGRCNDFARALGVRNDPAFIADVLHHGNATPIDLGRINGRYFCTVATVGIDAEVTGFVDRMRMPLRGTVAYVYGALRVLLRYQCYGLRLEGDFGVIDRPLFMASSANTSSYGGAIVIAPDADPSDGELDLCVIDAVSKWRAVTLVAAVLLGRHRSKPEVHFIRTGALKIDATTDRDIWADGERIATTPADVDVVPAALRVMLPARR